MILTTYKELDKEYNGQIVVSDTIIDLDSSIFMDKISNETNQGKVLDSLMKIDSKSNDDRYNYPVKKILNNNNKFGKYKFYFSKPAYRRLLVEVFHINKNESYDALTFFGQSKVYLFNFNDQKIVNVYQTELIYN